MSYTFPPVMPHEPIEEVFDGVFFVRGLVRMGPLMRIARNMVVVRQAEELTVVSAVRLSEEEEKKLDGLGRVTQLIKLGTFHGMDDPYYVDRYKPKVWALPGAKHAGDVSTDEELVEGGAQPIDDAEVFVFRDAVKAEAALLLKRAGGVLITCDSVQNWQGFAGCSLAARIFMRLTGFAGAANIGPFWLKYATPKEGTLRPDFERLLDHDFRHLLSAHGGVLRESAKEDLQKTVARVYG